MQHTEKGTPVGEAVEQPLQRSKRARVIFWETVVGSLVLIVMMMIVPNLISDPRKSKQAFMALLGIGDSVRAALAAYADESPGHLFPLTIADWTVLVRIVNAHGGLLKPHAAESPIKDIHYASDGCDYRLTITPAASTHLLYPLVVTPAGVDFERHPPEGQLPPALMGCTALMRAARQDDVATVHALLQEGVDVQARDREGRTAFMAAVAQGSASVVPSLLQAGVDVQARDREGRTALMTAASQGHAAIVSLLLQAGADVQARDREGRTALMTAAAQGHAAIVSLLLQAGADVQAPDTAGRTALMHVHSASHYPETQGATTTVRTLLAAGANVQASDQQGRTALMYAARQGATTTVHMLLAAGANVQIPDQQGRTVLMYAAHNYATSEDTVRTLLQAGADVHSRDQEGRTALMYAARESAAATARVLLQAGADVHAQDQRGRTAWVHASTVEQTHPGLVQVLKEFGARDPGLKRAVGRLRPRSPVAADPRHADGWEMVPRDVDNAWQYPQPGACTSFSVGFDRQHTGSLRLCVPAVVVYDSGDMEFHVTWRGEHVPSGYAIQKASDVDNRNMYVLDNLGNRYDHIALDGAARDRGSAGQGMELSGAFLFPPAQPGAFRFQFVDADQGVAIPNIELPPPAL